MKRRHAFTLIELLVVIAIIAILAAIIFPVFARARESAQRNGDLGSLNELRSALQLYKVDYGAYPPALLGYVNRYSSGPLNGQVIPADRITGFLFPKRVTSITTFRPALLNRANNLATTAVWPNQDPRAAGTAPQVDLNGDNVVNNADDTAGARQAYGPTDTVLRFPGLPAGSGNPALEFYQVSGYDVAQNPAGIGAGAGRWELRYTLFWSNFAIGSGAGFGNGSPFDDPRQLGYVDPPDNTVITWNSIYRDFEPAGVNRVPSRAKKDMILFLGGTARPFDSRQIWDNSWRVLP